MGHPWCQQGSGCQHWATYRIGIQPGNAEVKVKGSGTPCTNAIFSPSSGTGPCAEIHGDTRVCLKWPSYRVESACWPCRPYLCESFLMAVGLSPGRNASGLSFIVKRLQCQPWKPLANFSLVWGMEGFLGFFGFFSFQWLCNVKFCIDSSFLQLNRGNTPPPTALSGFFSCALLPKYWILFKK